MIHIDHFDEIIDLEKIADRLGKKIKVAIRVNMDTHSGTDLGLILKRDRL